MASWVFYGFKKLSWFLKVHFTFIKLKIPVKTISSYLLCPVLTTNFSFSFFLDLCFVKFVFTKVFHLAISQCITIVKFCRWCFNSFIPEGLFVASLGTFLLEAGDWRPDLWSAFSSLGLQKNSPLLCQHQAASTTETKTNQNSFSVFCFFSDKTRKFYVQGSFFKSILLADRNLKYLTLF